MSLPYTAKHHLLWQTLSRVPPPVALNEKGGGKGGAGVGGKEKKYLASSRSTYKRLHLTASVIQKLSIDLNLNHNLTRRNKKVWHTR